MLLGLRLLGQGTWVNLAGEQGLGHESLSILLRPLVKY